MRVLAYFLLASSLTTLGQTTNKGKVRPADSVQVKTRIESFYKWYAEQIKDRVEGECPTFARAADGTTTLDFTKYKDGLKKHGFSDRFINQKTGEYKICVDNLSKIEYNTFLTFTDLDQFEEMECAFNNVHEWTADMEPHDGAEMIGVESIDKNTLVAKVQFFNLNRDGRKYIWDYKVATVTLLRQRKDWKIDNLRIDRL